MQTDNSQTTLWPTLVKAIDRIQEKAIYAETSESLVTLLLEMDELPVDKKNIAIVYQNYGAKRPEFWAIGTDVRKREIHPVTHKTLSVTDEPSTDFSADHPLILRVIGSGQREYLKSSTECVGERLPEEYQSFLVVPMTIRSGRTIGAFILFSKEDEDAFAEELAEVMDILSNRFAYFIRHNIRRRRNVAFQYIQNQLYRQRYERECALIDDFVQGLTAWFEHDKVEILIKHPLDTSSFIRACCIDERDEEGNRLGIHSIRNFRLKPALSEDEISHLLGDTRTEIARQPLVLNSEDEIKKRGITITCKSWLATPMRLKKNVNVGYLILYNEDVESAFDSDEDILIDSLSDAVAMMIGTLRSEHFQEAQREIRESKIPKKIGNSANSFIDSLCHTTVENLKKLYGVEALTILRYQHSDAGLEGILNNNPEINEIFSATAKEKKGFSRLISASELIDKVGTNEEADKSWIRVYFGTLKAAMMDIMLSSHLRNSTLSRKTLHIRDESSGVAYFVAPMRSGTHSVGCFLFPAAHIGGFTAQAIDDLADTFGKRIVSHESERRFKLLTDYGRIVSTGGAKNKKDMLSSAKEFIGQVMYTKHLYVALYDRDKNEICFELALHNGKPWKGVHGSKRQLDKGQLGKTEKIILTGEPILHYTRVESEKWYRESGHKEHAGNALASWLGVPIHSERGVVGVIATYHESLDYIFSERDQFFLQQIAGDVAGMLKALELEEKQTIIAEQQHILSSTLLSHDLTHRLNNSIGAISININQVLRDIQEAQRSGRMNHFAFTEEALEDTELVLSDLVVDLKEISDEVPRVIDLRDLLNKVIPQIETSKKLANSNISVIKKNLDLYSPSILAHKRTLFNSVHSVISNAADALIYERNNSGNADLSLEVELINKNSILELIITDNGKKLSEDESKGIFDFGVSGKGSSGFGLWRAKQVFKSIGGDISLDKSLLPHIKKFTITLPSSSYQQKEKLAIVVDDERSWRNILSRWLSEKSYNVELASSEGEAQQVFDNIKNNMENEPDYIFLDVALDKYEGTNVDGLNLISVAKSLFPSSKIIVVTGYASLSEAYKGDYHHLIQKIDENGNILTSEMFFKSISNAKIKYMEY